MSRLARRMMRHGKTRTMIQAAIRKIELARWGALEQAAKKLVEAGADTGDLTRLTEHPSQSVTRDVLTLAGVPVYEVKTTMLGASVDVSGRWLADKEAA